MPIENAYLESTRDIPVNTDVVITVVKTEWGKSRNLKVYCQTDENVEFWFSVYNNNNYSTRAGDVSFRSEDTIGKSYIAVFSRTAKGYLDIKSAQEIV